MEPHEEVLNALVQLVDLMVDRPDLVRVEATVTDRSTNFVIRANGGNLGQLIGVKEETVNALRSLLKAMGKRHKTRYGLSVVEIAKVAA